MRVQGLVVVVVVAAALIVVYVLMGEDKHIQYPHVSYTWTCMHFMLTFIHTYNTYYGE